MSGEELKALRTAAGWSREKLARQLGVIQGTVFAWEHGKRAIPGPSVIALRAVLEGVVPAGAPMAEEGDLT